ncbi:MAG: di-heme oxidoredictase family protein [Bacteroidota bacterium]
MNKKLLSILIMSLSFFSCSNDEPEITEVPLPVVEEGEELSSGDLGLNITGSDAFGFSLFGLDVSGISQFQQGNSLFNQSWVMATGDATRMDDGLGPTFNAISCSSCHFADGRGRPLVNGQNSNGFLVRLSIPGQDEFGGPLGVPGYGGQLQDLAIDGVTAEAKVTVTYENIDGSYPDGTSYQLRKPVYTINEEQFGSLAGVQVSPRVGQQTIGMGLISALPDSEILRFADEFDSDGDGISGRPNLVWNFETNEVSLGKYGWKANVPTLKSQIASAFNGDMGLTTSVFSNQDCPSPQQDCIDSPSGGTPEVSDDQLEKVLFYQATLVVPNRRNVSDESVLFGRDTFREINCIGCHAVNQVTSSSTISPLLENVTIRPYSDFLLHDMGADLADGRPDFVANGTEWRTQPLWGIGLISDVNDHTFLLHDGRARNIEEAILWHGGEAQRSKEAFMELTAEQRQQVLDFVNSL